MLNNAIERSEKRFHTWPQTSSPTPTKRHHSHCSVFSGEQLNGFPPNCTMTICVKREKGKKNLQLIHLPEQSPCCKASVSHCLEPLTGILMGGILRRLLPMRRYTHRRYKGIQGGYCPVHNILMREFLCPQNQEPLPSQLYQLTIDCNYYCNYCNYRCTFTLFYVCMHVVCMYIHTCKLHMWYTCICMHTHTYFVFVKNLTLNPPSISTYMDSCLFMMSVQIQSDKPFNSIHVCHCVTE